jgi:hypothetical protein
MANQSCRQRASAGATALPTSPSSSRGRPFSSSIARCGARPPRPCCPPPPPSVLRPPSSVVAQSATYILAALTPRHTVPPADAQVKHEARPFDGERPCHRSVIVQFIRKPVKDGSDKILLDL